MASELHFTNFEHKVIPIEMDLCALLESMKLDVKPAADVAVIAHAIPSPSPLIVQDVPMLDDPSHHSDGTSEHLSSSSNPNFLTLANCKDEPHGCAYLQALQSQLETYQTTGGEYLEAIFTHREVFMSFPPAHTSCARGFSDLAYSIEQRAWRADREADIEAVSAFRHEAWMIAAYL